MQSVLNPLCRENLEDGRLKPRKWDRMTVVCVDIVDFTFMSGSLKSETVCKMLTRFYDRMDLLSVEHHVDKVDIIGDSYLAMSVSAANAVRFCLDAVALSECTMWDEDDPTQGNVVLRCGVHTGPVVGLVLESAPYKYTLVGESMVKAKQLEGMGDPGTAHCSDSTVTALDDAEFNVAYHTVGDPSTYSVTWAAVNRKTVVCPHSLRFVSVSDRFVWLFGFVRKELISLRMVYGPLTHTDAVQSAMDQCYQFDCPTRTAVVLYNKQAQPVCTAMEFNRNTDVALGVDVQCSEHVPRRLSAVQEEYAIG
jgi:class 3 adenylate cyclase